VHKGILKFWKNDKGYGFIKSEELKKDVFIHMSTLSSMSRKPRKGDVIHFEVRQKDNGKEEAYNCSIEGVALLPGHKAPGSGMSTPVKVVIACVVLAGAALLAYQLMG
jgi:cold shock CspA family protein